VIARDHLRAAAAHASHFQNALDRGALAFLFEFAVQLIQPHDADFRVFQDPSLFSTCYQPYAQAMLPYAASAGTGSARFDFATVEPVVVPVPPDGSGTQVAAFQIALIGTDKGQTVTAVTTAIAVYGGRLQATLKTISDLVFPLDVQDALVHSIEARVIGASLL
jgi:hypothetical protein